MSNETMRTWANGHFLCDDLIKQNEEDLKAGYREFGKDDETFNHWATVLVFDAMDDAADTWDGQQDPTPEQFRGHLRKAIIARLNALWKAAASCQHRPGV